VPGLKAQLLSMTVDNEFGVLTRVTALIRREGWNIKSLSVAESADPSVSRLTVCIECLDSVLGHVRTRLEKLDCVHSLTVFDPSLHQRVELAAVRMKEENGAAIACARSFGALPYGPDRARAYTLTADPERIDAFVTELASLGVDGVVRTGAVMVKKRAADDMEACAPAQPSEETSTD